MKRLYPLMIAVLALSGWSAQAQTPGEFSAWPECAILWQLSWNDDDNPDLVNHKWYNIYATTATGENCRDGFDSFITHCSSNNLATRKSHRLKTENANCTITNPTSINDTSNFAYIGPNPCGIPDSPLDHRSYGAALTQTLYLSSLELRANRATEYPEYENVLSILDAVIGWHGYAFSDAQRMELLAESLNGSWQFWDIVRRDPEDASTFFKPPELPESWSNGIPKAVRRSL